MIQTEKEHGKAKRGRPPKVQAPEVSEATSEGSVASVDEKGPPWIFKSKYTEDVIWLKPPRRELRPDGSVFIDPGMKSEFHKNTRITSDSLEAQLLRSKIKEAEQLGAPLNIVETT